MLYRHPHFVPRVSAVQGDIATALIDNWIMDDAHVTTFVLDSGSNNLAGTMHGSVTSATGPGGVGTARAFDATNTATVITLGASPFNWNTGSFSIAGWVSLTNNTVTQGGNRVAFFADDRTGDGLTNYIRVFNNNNVANGSLAVNVSDNGASTGVATAAGVIASNAATFVHFAYTNSGGGAGGTKALYINGAPVTPVASAGGGSGAIVSVIGALTATPAGIITGRMYKLAIWSRALTQADVLLHFNTG